MLEINAFLKDNFIVVNAEKKERKVINMTREKVIKVIESTFLDENIDKELYILYGERGRRRHLLVGAQP